MNLSEKIATTVASLPKSKQLEVLDFVEYLKLKMDKKENDEWNDFSIASAMRGMEDDDSDYSVTEINNPPPA